MAKQEQVGPVAPLNTELVNYFRAGYPLLYMVTSEEDRAETEITRAASELQRQVFLWSATDGLINIMKPGDRDAATVHPHVVMDKIKKGTDEKIVYVFRDLHPYFGVSAGIVVRQLRDLAKILKKQRSTVILISPVAKLPPELHHDAVQIDYDMPKREHLQYVFDQLTNQNKKALNDKGVQIDDDEKEKIISAAMGLTNNEAENAFSKAIIMRLYEGTSISGQVMKEKAAAVKKSGILEYFETTVRLGDIGGLEIAKAWIKKRSKSFTKKAREFGLPYPKGILAVGIPGGGKSLLSKATSHIMGVPMIRFDIARIFGGIVGETENNTRIAIQTIDAVGPCVVWLDELEKAFAGGGSGGGGAQQGHETTRRAMGTFLTWMQERTTPSFIVATCNSIAGLPPEFLRKGRFDEQFYIGPPGIRARQEIVEIHLKKQNRDQRPIDREILAASSKDFTGAEIEQCIIEGLFNAFDDGRDLETKDVLKAMQNTRPIIKAFQDELGGMVSWAKENAVNASAADQDTEYAAGRALDIA